MMKLFKVIFLILIIVIILIFIKKAFYALLLGLVFSFIIDDSISLHINKTSKVLIQLSVITMAFSISTEELINHSQKGFYITAFLVLITIVLGFLTGKLLKLTRNRSLLISAGTAICGGAAIAAVSQSIDADDSDISISLSTIFIFNGLALVIFPLLAQYFQFSQSDYGLWAAVAIHDTSSVLASSRDYGDISLEIATVVKLTRTLWIIPLMLIFLLGRKSKKRVSLPYFIIAFILCLLFQENINLTMKETIVNTGKHGFTLSLFFIGLCFDLKKIKLSDFKSFILGFILWLIISGISFILIYKSVI